MSPDPGGGVPAKSRAKYLSTDPKTGLGPVDEVLASLIERHGGPAGLAGARVLEEWEDVAGAEWQGRARPLSVKDGVLVVEVESAAEATLLRYDEGAIRARIQARHGAGIVRSIRVKVAGSRSRR